MPRPLVLNAWLRRPLVLALWIVGTTLLVVVARYVPRKLDACSCSVHRTTPMVMYTVHGAIEHYAADNDGACAPSLIALVDLRYLKAMPRDTWGHAFRYRCDTPAGDAFRVAELTSAGADGRFDTADDLHDETRF